MAVPYDEMHNGAGGIRAHYGRLAERLAATPPERMAAKRAETNLLFRRVGITFAVYGESAAGTGADGAPPSTKRLIPFDIIPRVSTLGG